MSATDTTKYSKRLYRIFQGMKKRCYNKNTFSFKYYGARGITIYQEWLDDPDKFCEWSINNGYYDQPQETEKSQILSIDRINPDKGYSPDNCQWITLAENAGKDKGIYITVNKITQTLTQWSLYFNLKKHYFGNYYRRHGLQETTKLIRQFYLKERKAVDSIAGTYIEVNGERLTLSSWSKKFLVSKRYFITFYQRFGETKTIKQITKFLNYNGDDISELFLNSIPKLTVNEMTMTYSEWDAYLGKHKGWCKSIIQRHKSAQYLINKIKLIISPEQLSEQDKKILEPKQKGIFITVNDLTFNLVGWGRYLKLKNEEYLKSYYKLHGEEKTIQRIESLINGDTVGKKSPMLTIQGVTHDCEGWAKLTDLKKQTIIVYISKYGNDYAIKKIMDNLK